ncbi:hypothetical protein KGA66_08365 [Actinocrinis puniceicyclus]|uniref:Uncharacterized protein n=1 Tax=Actinocrinis puniceicyclus TaxID=977794 RepID=A0A8J8BDR5_9ACTN|nr:hypothetical protein [Actinocrinis puniceicyclus]MBS2963054.1 hypothetical protein [Actinocrinis puniceicyclus]
MSTSTDSPPSAAPAPTRRRPAAKPIAVCRAAGEAVAGRAKRFLSSSAWRRAKRIADVALAIVVFGALGWTACNAVFLGTRAVANRGVAVVHLGGQPEIQISWIGGGEPRYAVLPSEVLTGSQKARVSISVANDSPDGVVVKPATLTGPYLAGPARLLPDDGTGYILGNGTIHYVGVVTVNCDAAVKVARTLVYGGQTSRMQPTAISFSLRDTNKVMHTAYLVIDTTASAVQGRVCTR